MHNMFAHWFIKRSSAKDGTGLDGALGRTSAYWAYLVALPGIAITVAFRWQLSQLLGERGLYSTQLPIVILAAHLGGFWPGCVITFLGALATNFIVVNHLQEVELEDAGDSVAMIMFVVTGVVISLLSESLHRAQRRIIEEERRRAALSLEQTEKRFAHLVENSSDIITLFTPDGTILYQTPSVAQVLGYRSEERIGRNVFRDPIVHPDDLLAKQAFFTKMLAHPGSPLIAEFRLRHRDGYWRYIEAIGQNLLDEPGIDGLIVNYRDITDRKLADQKVRDSEQRWRSLAQLLPQLIWTMNGDGRSDYFSPQVREYTGLTEEQLLAGAWLETVHQDDYDGVVAHWRTAVAAQRSYELEHRIRRKDGVYGWFKVSAVPVTNNEGDVTRWIGSCTNVTESKETEHALREAKEAAESANRAKDEFLANVSHEIRTPMNAILGMTELVLESSLSESQHRLLQTVKSAGDNLLNILNDLLDFSRIEAGKLRLDPTAFSLRQSIGDVARMLATRAHAQGLEFVCDVDDDVPDSVVGDAGRLRQILLNLIGNAIKFTPSGEVVVNVAHREERANSGKLCLEFSIRDTGIGIPADKQQSIFRAFEQEDMSTTRKYGGTGLGLTISSYLVREMGGEISVESGPGQGSTFRFDAWFERSDEHFTTTARPLTALEGRRVLVVDDNETNRLILENWLRRWRLDAACVADGISAVTSLSTAAQAGHPFDLVVLDRRMPEVDGVEVVRRIRGTTAIAGLPVILLTSGDPEDEEGEVRQVKVQARLTKPCQQTDLLDAIQGVLSRTEVSTGETVIEPESPTALLPELRILLAEDNEFNAMLLDQLLKKHGHAVTIASNGRIALETATRDRFDVLLLDIHMPELDGFQVARALREHELSTGKRLPILALTARSTPQIRDQCLAAGMDDVLSKPMKAEQLWTALGRLSTTSQEAEMSDNDLIDREMLLSVCGGSDEMLSAIVQSFLQNSPKQMQQMEHHLAQAEMPALREAAHRLAGTLRAFSRIAGEEAIALEEAAENGLADECRQRTTILTGYWQQLRKQVTGLTLQDLHGTSKK